MFKTSVKWIMAVAILAATSVMSSCSSDDSDEPGPGKTGNTIDIAAVFPKGVPQAGISGVTYNSDGLVSSFVNRDGKKVTFDYVNIDVESRADEGSSYIMMTLSGEKEVPHYCKMYLNEQGYVKYCEERYEESGDNLVIWDLEYNSDGQLSKVRQSEFEDDEDEDAALYTICTLYITYQNGDITKVKGVYEEEWDSFETTVSYTSSYVEAPIANDGGVMFFSDGFNIYLDALEYAYYAGVLGKGTAHLPLKTYSSYPENGNGWENTGMAWTMNAQNLPQNVKFDFTYDDDDHNGGHFNWDVDINW